MVIVTETSLNPTEVNAGGKVMVRIKVRETVDEPMAYRLAFRLGEPKGSLGGGIKLSGISLSENGKMPFDMGGGG